MLGADRQLRQHPNAFTLIELIIVIALLAFVIVVAFPNFNFSEESRVSSKLSRLSADVRSAFDLAVLSGRPHRLVFHLGSGDYWLQSTDSQNVLLGDRLVDRDPSPQEERARLEEFDRDFEEYIDLAGESFIDPESEEDIPPASPVLKAKNKLRGPQWFEVKEGEWARKRSLGPELIIKDIQAEHHQQKIDLLESRGDAFSYIYIQPTGYIEKAVLHLYYRLDETSINDKKPPYTFITQPYDGSAKLLDGYVEIDVRGDDEF